MRLIEPVIGKFGGIALRAAATFCLVLGPVHAIPQAPVGIPRDLARLRAQQLNDVRYQLAFTITPKADFISGHEELRFVQNADDRRHFAGMAGLSRRINQQPDGQRRVGVDGNTKWPRRASRQVAQAG